jgi:hypothetical protein
MARKIPLFKMKKITWYLFAFLCTGVGMSPPIIFFSKTLSAEHRRWRTRSQVFGGLPPNTPFWVLESRDGLILAAIGLR